MTEHQKKLFEWFHANKRDLPFRKNNDAYRIWVSEVMLQQTRVNAMLPLYEKFLERFPDIPSLSRASEQEVIRHWKGLGYYSRAINLLKGAKFLAKHHSATFPDTLDEALKVPGVGPYTARAILSIAFNQPLAVLDGNVKRVLSRVFLFDENIESHSSTKKLQAFADEFLNLKFPGDHNEAMMELGATLCGMRPDCAECPLFGFCKAREKGVEIFARYGKKS